MQFLAAIPPITKVTLGWPFLVLVDLVERGTSPEHIIALTRPSLLRLWRSSNAHIYGTYRKCYMQKVLYALSQLTWCDPEQSEGLAGP
jgi:hypothetical protein